MEFEVGPLRTLTEAEKRLLGILLVGSDPSLVASLGSARVQSSDAYGSLLFDLPDVIRDGQISRQGELYLDGEYLDEDGIPVWFLVFAWRGQLEALEVARADGSHILRPPGVGEIEVIRYPDSLK